MKTTRTTVTLWDTKFDVDYWYSEGFSGTYWEPPEPSELEIEGVYIAGYSMQDMLRDDAMEAIMNALEKQLIEERNQYEEDCAEAEYEYWKELEHYI